MKKGEHSKLENLSVIILSYSNWWEQLVMLIILWVLIDFGYTIWIKKEHFLWWKIIESYLFFFWWWWHVFWVWSGLLWSCRNMPGQALMVRPSARLETMALVKRSYVLVRMVDKRRQLSLYGCYFLIYVIRRPCSLDISLTTNWTLSNVWFHVQT